MRFILPPFINPEMLLLQILFWLAIAWVFYANIGYALLLWIISRFVHREVKAADISPTVSFLIAAHNVESVIAAKLENTLASDYPPEKLQIIVMSDASTDRTDEIVHNFAGRGVVLNTIPIKSGKQNAINQTLPIAKGDILVFSDADSTYAPDVLRKLVCNFAEPEVGAVTGEEIRIPTQSGKGTGEGLYTRLDNLIKRLEGQLGCVVMVNGGFFSIRRVLYPIMEPYLIHDAVVPSHLVLQGYRTAYEPEAHSFEVYPLDTKGDFNRRLRTISQAFYSYLSVSQALNPFRTGWYAVKLFSHRFTRWFVFPWLLVAFITNMLLTRYQPIYMVVFVGQIFCYACAALGWLLDSLDRRIKLFYFPFYFLYIHLAAFIAVVQSLSGKRIATWTPTERVAAE